jgi:hypothetical protein
LSRAQNRAGSPTRPNVTPSLERGCPIGQRGRAGRSSQTAEFLNAKRPCQSGTTDRASARGSSREDTSDLTPTLLARAARSHKSNIAAVFLAWLIPDERPGADPVVGPRSRGAMPCRSSNESSPSRSERPVQLDGTISSPGSGIDAAVAIRRHPASPAFRIPSRNRSMGPGVYGTDCLIQATDRSGWSWRSCLMAVSASSTRPACPKLAHRIR